MGRNKKNINRLGFVDISMRDADNNTIFKQKGQNLGNAIRSFEKFLEEKYGVRGFSAYDETEYQKKQRKKSDLKW
jgi:hypothetical protein|tara:strand:+ start:2115 stop:2339 length:225 start_codon:yes stop_codon:yes gene_type:complete